MTPEELKEFLASITLNWEELIPQITPLIEADAESAAKDFLLSVGISQVTDPDTWTKVLAEAQEYAKTRSAELVGKKILNDGTIVDNPNAAWSITQTTRDRLRQIGDQTIAEGWTVNETQSAIVDDTAFSQQRALNISRTERAFARGRGNFIAAKGSSQKYKSWLLGEEACEICQANAAQGWIPIDEAFQSGDDCVPAHPSCRCSNAYSNSEDGIDTNDDEEADDVD